MGGSRVNKDDYTTGSLGGVMRKARDKQKGGTDRWEGEKEMEGIRGRGGGEWTEDE